MRLRRKLHGLKRQVGVGVGDGRMERIASELRLERMVGAPFRSPVFVVREDSRVE